MMLLFNKIFKIFNIFSRFKCKVFAQLLSCSLIDEALWESVVGKRCGEALRGSVAGKRCGNKYEIQFVIYRVIYRVQQLPSIIA